MFESNRLEGNSFKTAAENQDREMTETPQNDAIEGRGVTPGAGRTKARIERAALNLFAARNIDAVTTREIAAASQVSEGAIYRHYPSKAALAETLFFTIHKRLAGAIAEAGAEHNGIDAQTRAIVNAYCQTADEDWALFSYHLFNAHRFLPGVDRKEAGSPDSPVAQVETIIATAMQKGDLPHGDAALKAAMALGVVLQAALHKLYGRVDGALSDHKPKLANAAIAVLHS